MKRVCCADVTMWLWYKESSRESDRFPRSL